MKSRCAKIGIVIAVIISIFAARLAKKWEPQESVAYNVFILLVHPYISPSVVPIIEQPSEAHIALFEKITKGFESSATESSARFFGDDFWEASFGANQTRIAELSVPSTTDSNHSIPITCTCPHDASMKSNLPLVLYYFGGGLILGSTRLRFFKFDGLRHKFLP
jgi:acetyl esterase/lipase